MEVFLGRRTGTNDYGKQDFRYESDPHRSRPDDQFGLYSSNKYQEAQRSQSESHGRFVDVVDMIQYEEQLRQWTIWWLGFGFGMRQDSG
jgi:hypothetical protein